MMVFNSRLAAACLVVAAPFFAISPAKAQKAAAESDEFFKKHTIVHLNLEIGPKEMDALRREPRKYVTTTLKEGDKGAPKVYKDVGVHLKGAAGSFRGIDDKAGLTINMDKFGSETLFYGMDKFHLANSLQDPSYIAELICGELMLAAGVPASRCSHAVVAINGQRRGFYYLKEGFDTNFLNRYFKTKHGNFYDGGFLREIDQPLQLISGKEDVKPHADLKKLLAASREANPKERFQKMERLLEMDKFISYLALEVMCWDWDGYPMNRNNYRIYHDPIKDKLTFIPSGMDQMFGDPNGPLFPNFQGQVARAVLETPEGKSRYIKRVEELLQTTFRSDLLNKRLDEVQAKVQPALAAVDANAGRDLPNQINRLRGGIRQRAQRLEQELKRMKK
jgi:spore coat protein H